MAVLLRGDFDASRLRGLAKKTKDGPQTRRLLALAAIYDGATRTEAAKIGGVGLQIIRDWVLRFNARGPDGLLNGKKKGPRRGPFVGRNPNMYVSGRRRDQLIWSQRWQRQVVH